MLLYICFCSSIGPSININLIFSFCFTFLPYLFPSLLDVIYVLRINSPHEIFSEVCVFGIFNHWWPILSYDVTKGCFNWFGTVTLIEDGFYFRNRECSKESCTSLEQDLGLAIMPEGNLTMEVYRFDYFIYFAIFPKTCFQRVEFRKNVSTS